MRIITRNHVSIIIFVYICLLSCATSSSIIENHLEECKSKSHVEKFQVELQDLKKLQKRIPQRKKRSIASNYEDAHCLKNFETKDNAIIKTKESQANGAQYLNETKVATFEFCLRYCCETNLCNVAVYDIQVAIKMASFQKNSIIVIYYIENLFLQHVIYKLLYLNTEWKLLHV